MTRAEGPLLAGPQQGLGLAQRLEAQVFGILLAPFERCGVAIEAQREAVLGPGRGIAGPEPSGRAGLVVEAEIGIVEDLATRREGLQAGGEAARGHAADVSHQVVGMRSHLAEDGLRAHRSRTEPPMPVGGIVGFEVDPRRTAGEFRLDHAQAA